MNRSEDLSRLLERISLFDIRSYLDKKGWRRLTARDDRWTVFCLMSDDDLPPK